VTSLANITQNQYTRSEAAIALALAKSVVLATVNDPLTGLPSKARSTDLTTANSTLLAAVANAIKQTTTTLNGRTTTIEEVAQSVDGLNGKYTIKVDSNGYVAGFGLAVTTNNSTPTSEFTIVADQFSIAPVNTPLATAQTHDSSPFFYNAVGRTINDEWVPSGLYVKNANIVNLTAKNIKAGGITADRLDAVGVYSALVKAGMLTATTINGVTIEGVTITGGTITGGTVQSASGRIVMTGDTLTVKDPSDNIRVRLGNLA
jgi:hypothetical protein